MDERQKLMEQIMAYDFCMIDLGLFLDTHPADANALNDFRTCYMESEKLRKQFEEKYGPINQRFLPNPRCWQWVDDPWPWAREA